MPKFSFFVQKLVNCRIACSVQCSNSWGVTQMWRGVILINPIVRHIFIYSSTYATATDKAVMASTTLLPPRILVAEDILQSSSPQTCPQPSKGSLPEGPQVCGWQTSHVYLFWFLLLLLWPPLLPASSSSWLLLLLLWIHETSCSSLLISCI